MSQGRHALLIASTTFDDSRLNKLSSPSRDVAQLAEVLADPALGDYAVETCENKGSREVRHALELFFRARHAEDLVLLYVSTHGVKDESGNLFFAAVDTSLDAINSTTIESSFIHRLSGQCRARRQVFILDSCFSGAFGRVWERKSPPVLHREDVIGEVDPALAESHVRGLVVFSASTSYQYAFEGGDPVGSAEPSVFTKHLIHGMRSGEADLDGDGRITDDELYRYVADATRDEQPAQTPQRWVIGASGELVLGRSARVHATPLPVELEQLFAHPLTRARLVAVASLAEVALGRNRGLAASALSQLQRFATEDDSNQVRLAAQEALAGLSAPEAAATTPSTKNPAASTPPGVARDPDKAQVAGGSTATASASASNAWSSKLLWAGVAAGVAATIAAVGLPPVKRTNQPAPSMGASTAIALAPAPAAASKPKLPADDTAQAAAAPAVVAAASTAADRSAILGRFSVDVFWCTGSSGDANAQANEVAEALRTAVTLARLRVRKLEPGGVWASGYEIRVEADGSEDAPGRELARILSEKVPRYPFAGWASQTRTPGYISLFVCPGTTGAYQWTAGDRRF